jgi:hypothetical protein
LNDHDLLAKREDVSQFPVHPLVSGTLAIESPTERPTLLDVIVRWTLVDIQGVRRVLVRNRDKRSLGWEDRSADDC